MLKRSMFLFFLTAAIWAIEIFVVQGENVFWTFAFVDQMYRNANTNPQDVSLFIVDVTYILIWGLGMWWVVGFFDRWFE
jgi:hypothetical protein